MLQTSLLALLASALVMAPAVDQPLVPPPGSLFNQSWEQMVKAPRYQTDCKTVAGALTAGSGLTADEQQKVDVIMQALPKLSVRDFSVFGVKDRKMSALREKAPSFLPYAAYITNQLSYADALQNIQQTPNLRVEFVVNSQGMYYRSAAADPWKVIKSKELADSVLKSLSDNQLAEVLEKVSFDFERWDANKPTWAVYKGVLTQEGAKGVVGDTIGADFASDSVPNEVRVKIDKNTKQLVKIEATLSVSLGKATFPLTRTCQISYGNAVKVAIPSKAKSMDVKIGAQEFLDLAHKVQ